MTDNKYWITWPKNYHEEASKLFFDLKINIGEIKDDDFDDNYFEAIVTHSDLISLDSYWCNPFLWGPIKGI